MREFDPVEFEFAQKQRIHEHQALIPDEGFRHLTRHQAIDFQAFGLGIVHDGHIVGLDEVLSQG